MKIGVAPLQAYHVRQYTVHFIDDGLRTFDFDFAGMKLNAVKLPALRDCSSEPGFDSHAFYDVRLEFDSDAWWFDLHDLHVIGKQALIHLQSNGSFAGLLAAQVSDYQKLIWGQG